MGGQLVGRRRAGDVGYGGTALDVRGRARFSRSGKATIAAGQTGVPVGVGSVTADTLVFAVLRSTNRLVFVTGARPDPGSGTIGIYINVPAPTTLEVSWFVVN